MLLLVIAALLPITILSVLQGMVRLETRRAAVIQRLSESAAQLADSNAAVLAGTESLLRVVAMNPDTARPGPACQAALIGARNAMPSLANIVLVGSDGMLRCAATGPANPHRIANAAWWAAIRSSPTPLIGDATISRFTGRRVTRMAIPLHGPDGAFSGVIIGAIDLRWLGDRLLARAAGDNTGVAIISDSGQVLMQTHALPALDVRTPAGTIGRVQDARGISWSYTVVPLVRAAPGQHGLYVAYADPEPARFGFAWWQTIIDFALPVLAIVLACLAIWVGARRLVLRWLLALQRLALHFAGGDYRHRPVSFADAPREIRSVAASLYRMSGAVNERDRRLRDALERQRLLAREVHHRVKNNFQVVMSLLSLQSARLDDENARAAIEQARRRIGALALVHRLLYDSGELASVSSRALLGALCDQLQPKPATRLTLHCEFDDVPLDIDSAVPLTLWLVETVNNAFHHGYPPPRGGTVCAVFRTDKDRATLDVSDDGIGFDADVPPTAQPGGYGLRLIKAIAAQLGGTAELSRRPEGGSLARLEFPLKAVVGTLEPVID